jgi:hypothetical protein
MSAGRGHRPQLGGGIELDIDPGKHCHRPADLAPSLVVETEYRLFRPCGAKAVRLSGVDLD